MGNLGIKWDYMKKVTKGDKISKYIDLHIRLPIDLGKMFIDDSKKQRRKYADQMAIILEQHYRHCEEK